MVHVYLDRIWDDPRKFVTSSDLGNTWTLPQIAVAYGRRRFTGHKGFQIVWYYSRDISKLIERGATQPIVHAGAARTMRTGGNPIQVPVCAAQSRTGVRSVSCSRIYRLQGGGTPSSTVADMCRKAWAKKPLTVCSLPSREASQCEGQRLFVLHDG